MTDLCRLAIERAPRGLFGACDADCVNLWAMATFFVEEHGPLPSLLKMQRRMVAELGFDPLEIGQSALNR